MARFFLCLAAAACCCLVLLPVPPVQGRLGSGLAGGSFEGSRDHTLTGESFTAAEYHPGTTAKAKPAWSLSWTAAAAGRVRPELRSVPGGPDPLHHHGSPWWPELEPTTP
ncbi:unnamed protein product [Urochloa decumbens]|uniref:Uncharacterized protein n=1 Tax=Urochloa decumbens TaxID=240449 RepID=A0ABC9APR6_9POAL